MALANRVAVNSGQLILFWQHFWSQVAASRRPARKAIRRAEGRQSPDCDSRDIANSFVSADPQDRSMNRDRISQPRPPKAGRGRAERSDGPGEGHRKL